MAQIEKRKVEYSKSLFGGEWQRFLVATVVDFVPFDCSRYYYYGDE
jgi:hypothetical protein